MRAFLTIVLTLVTAGAAVGQTMISGNLGGINLDSTGNPFIIEKSVVVPKGKSVVINAGCVLLFKAYTDLTINGNCTVSGTPEHPVVFTSFNDSAYNVKSTQPVNAFDWNGIIIAKESGDVLFKNVNVRYSVFGIKSQNPDIMISHGVFKQNGQFHFTINDKIQTVQDDQPYSYNEEKAAQRAAPTVQSVPVRSRKVRIVRYSLLGAGAAGSVAGIILSMDAKQKYDHWKKIEQETSPLPPPGEYDRRKKAYASSFTNALITDIVGGLCLIGFGITFAF